MCNAKSTPDARHVVKLDVRDAFRGSAASGDGEHRGRQVDAERRSFVRQTRRVAGRLAAAAADVEHLVGAPDRETVEVTVGDMIVSDAEERHWHGAADQAGCAFVSISRGTTTWL